MSSVNTRQSGATEIWKLFANESALDNFLRTAEFREQLLDVSLKPQVSPAVHPPVDVVPVQNGQRGDSSRIQSLTDLAATAVSLAGTIAYRDAAVSSSRCSRTIY
jgi:hypothetical protein